MHFVRIGGCQLSLPSVCLCLELHKPVVSKLSSLPVGSAVCDPGGEQEFPCDEAQLGRHEPAVAAASAGQPHGETIRPATH